MKRIIALILCLGMVLCFAACGGNADAPAAGTTVPAETTAAKPADNVFMAGFGVKNITPKGSVSMSGYGDHDTRYSDGLLSYLEARCVALIDENGDKLLLLTGDISFAYPAVGGQVLQKIEKELKIPSDHVVISGTHTHSSVATWMTGVPAVVEFNIGFVNGMVEAAKEALADCKPAKAYIGSAETESLNFVRRYYMDDGSLIADNTPGTGTTIVSHETEADNELQLLKFVREGGKDILIANFQAHPHLEGKTNSLSAQTPGAFRDYMENTMDIHCMYWNGAAGNINSSSRITSEMRTKDRVEYGKLLGDYAIGIYDSMTEVQTGPIKVTGVDFKGRVNHSEHNKLADAQKVVAYFEACNDSGKTATYAQQFGINSLNHAKRIVSNASLGETSTLRLYAFSFGEVSGIVTEYEMFDTNGMQVKEGSPFEKTFIIGYSYPGQQGYVASELGYKNGGYEVDNSVFAAGTGEELVAAYLEMLNELHG